MARKRQAVLEELRERIGQLPTTPGVYLFKDEAGVVLYVGKAKTLRSRVASYFQPGANLDASRGPEIARMIADLVTDVDILPCDSEVDAVLHESRLIKDIRPHFNAAQKDNRTFPYLQITTDEDFPRVSITRSPRSEGVKLYGPFVSPSDLRASLPLLQRVFQFRTCNLDISEDDGSRRHFRPCILHNIKQCTAPCAARVSREDYREQIRHLRVFLESKGSQLRKELTEAMKSASEQLQFERAARLRDELQALEGLQLRGLVDEHIQPEAFFIDPAEGLTRLAEVLDLPEAPRTIEGIDIAHLAGEGLCGSMVVFIDGKPFRDGYRRYRIESFEGNDDFAAMREVVWRRYKHAGMNEGLFPDIVLVDGGPGQVNAAWSAFDDMAFRPPVLLGLAKKHEEIHVHARSKPIRLPRRDPALRVLQYVRDEAHRFAQHYHHILIRKAKLPDE